MSKNPNTETHKINHNPFNLNQNSHFDVLFPTNQPHPIKDTILHLKSYQKELRQMNSFTFAC